VRGVVWARDYIGMSTTVHMIRSFARESALLVYSTYLMPKANFPALVATSAVTVLYVCCIAHCCHKGLF